MERSIEIYPIMEWTEHIIDVFTPDLEGVWNVAPRTWRMREIVN